MLKITITPPKEKGSTHTFETVSDAIEFLNEVMLIEQTRSVGRTPREAVTGIRGTALRIKDNLLKDGNYPRGLKKTR